MLNLIYSYHVWDTAERRRAIKRNYPEQRDADKAAERLRRKHSDSPYGRFVVMLNVKRPGRRRRPTSPRIVYVGD